MNFCTQEKKKNPFGFSEKKSKGPPDHLISAYYRNAPPTCFFSVSRAADIILEKKFHIVCVKDKERRVLKVAREEPLKKASPSGC